METAQFLIVKEDMLKCLNQIQASTLTILRTEKAQNWDELKPVILHQIPNFLILDVCVPDDNYTIYFDGVVREDNIRYKFTVLNGKLQGEFVEYYEKTTKTDNIPEKITTYKDGVKHGVMTHYYSDGSIEKNSNVANGKLHGEEKEFYEDAIVTNMYNNGELVNTDVQYL
jgi:hypothetical protein